MRKLTTTYKIIESVTPEGYPELVYADRPKNLTELLNNTANRHSDREAFIDGNTRITCGQFARSAGNVASALHYSYGVRKGDRVALMLRNGLEFATSLFALAQIGAITVPLNTALKGEELSFQVRDSGATILIVERDFYELIAEATSGVEVKKIFVAGGETSAGTIAFSVLLQATKRALVRVDVEETDSAVIMYTSGTTGKPKGALLSHKGVIASAMNAAQLCDLRPGRDKMLIVAPLFHIIGLAMALCSCVYAGIPAVFMKRFKTADTLKVVAEEKVTTMFAVPTIFWLMLNAPEFDQYNLSSLRYLASGGAATPDDLLKCCAAKLPGAQLAPGYGLTEANGMTHSTTTIQEALGKPQIAGRAVPVIETRIADNNGRELPPGEPGELLVRGCQLMKEYWNNPEATRETLVDGWLHTGDIARMDEKGYLYILDRMKDMVIRGGENVYSIEVENVLYRHPKVLEAAVLGVPDPVFGEQVKAAIVLRAGEQATAEEIQEFCKKFIADYKVPKYIEFRESLPRNPAGKVIKSELK